MRSSSPRSRPSFPFLGAGLLLSLVGALCAFPGQAYLAAMFFVALGLISFGFGLPAPQPIPLRARGSRREP